VTENEAECRVAFSEEFLQVIRHAKETNFEHSLTGDGSWFYIPSISMIWIGPHQGPLFRLEKHRKFRPKGLVSIIWSISGVHSLLALSAGMRYDAEFFCAFVLLEIKSNLCDGKHRNTLRCVCLHLGNALAHNTRQSRQEIARTKVSRVVRPAYSRDAAPSNFFMFGHLKGEMAGFSANSLADSLSEIRRIFQDISKESLAAVYDE
jgi:hypothetical protein